MEFITELSDGRPQLRKKEAIVHLRDHTLPSTQETYSGIMEDLDRMIRDVCPGINTGSLSNAHGDWYEWMLAIEAWNLYAQNSRSHLALLLPNISRYDLADLYDQELRGLILDLRDKVQSSSEVKLISSNPDFVILSRPLVERVLGEIEPIDRLSIENLDMLDSVFQKFTGECGFEELIGYISVKSSLRPDRRLQISHEGSLMKAIYVHLQTRKWIINPPGLTYFAVSTRIGKPDRKALKTVATHSITTVSSIPQPAVDEVFEVNSVPQAQEALHQMLVPGE